MGAFDMLRIANTSLGFHQTWLDSLANNIANINTATPTSQNAFQAQMVMSRARPDGGVDVAGTTNGAVARIEPGQKVTLAPGRRAAVEGFAVNQSALGVAVTGPVLPLVVMPDGRRVAGFVEPGIEVNQVFGSLTRAAAGTRAVEVPAGVSGPYVLLLVGVGEGPFTVTVTGRHRGTETYRLEQSGEAHRGQGLRAEIIQTMSDGRDPRTARADRAGMSTLRPETARPGTVLLSPRELAAAPR